MYTSADDRAVCRGADTIVAFETPTSIVTCCGTWGFQVDADTAPGEYGLTFWHAFSTELQIRTITITVLEQSAVTIVEPAVSPGTTLHVGEAITVTTGLTINEPQGGAEAPYTQLTFYQGVLALASGSPVVHPADSAVCELADGNAEFKTTADTGACRGVWSFQVREGTPLGNYIVTFRYTVNGTDQTRIVTITVEAPQLVFDDPVVIGTQPFRPGQPFQIQTTVTLDDYWLAQMATDAESVINSWLTAPVPAVAGTTGQTACEAAAHSSSIGVTSGRGSCTLTWQLAVPNDAAPGDYVMMFANEYGPAAKSWSAPVPKSVTVTVGVRPGPPDPTPAPRLRVTPTEVVSGQSVTVSVTGFGANEVARVRWLVGGSWLPVGNLTTNTSGAGSLSVIVPSTAAVGQNKVRADSPTHAAQTGAVTLSIPLPPTVELNDLRVTVGQAVGFDAVHFPANTNLSVTWRRPGGSTVSLGTVPVDGTGTAIGTFTVPATEGGAESRVTFTVDGSSVMVMARSSGRKRTR
jgi:hypothetical protein